MRPGLPDDPDPQPTAAQYRSAARWLGGFAAFFFLAALSQEIGPAGWPLFILAGGVGLGAVVCAFAARNAPEEPPE